LRARPAGAHHWRVTRRLLLPALAAVTVALPLAPTARADDGGRADVRVERSCAVQSSIRLRVRAEDDDLLRVELDVRTPQRGARWSVSVVHERRLARSTTRRTSGSSRSFSLRFAMPDWPGADAVVVRAVGPRGEVCRAAVTVAA
jgi:hypothetical protein